MRTLGFDTSTSSTAVALRLDGRHGERAARRSRRRGRTRATRRGCWRWRASCSTARASAGTRSSGSRSGSARARSPACAWASRPRAGSRSRWRCRSWASRACRRSRTRLRRARSRRGRRRARRRILAVIDARRGEVFAAAYERRRATASPRELTAALALAPEKLGRVLARAEQTPRRRRRGAGLRSATGRYASAISSAGGDRDGAAAASALAPRERGRDLRAWGCVWWPPRTIRRSCPTTGAGRTRSSRSTRRGADGRER